MTESPQKPDREYTWDEVKALFITGQDSLSVLAVKVGKNAGTLYNHSCRHNWTEEREKYRSEVYEKKKAAAQKAVLDDKESFDALTDQTCDMIVAMISKRLTDLPDDEYIGADVLDKLARTTRTAQEVKYRRLDIPAPKQPIEYSEKDAFSEYQNKLAEARHNVETGISVVVDNGEGDEADDLVEVTMRPPVSEN